MFKTTMQSAGISAEYTLLDEATKHTNNLIDGVIDRAHRECLLESSFQDNSNKSIDALRNLRALGAKPTKLLLEHESYRSLNDYSLLHKACLKCLSLGMNLAK